MNPEVKKKWVEALRSGEYKQAQGKLHKKDGFCCLGVLCDLDSKETKTPWGESCSSGAIPYMENTEFLPISVRRWAGIDKDSPVVPWKGGEETLALLNDRGSTFPEIADLIEKHL